MNLFAIAGAIAAALIVPAVAVGQTTPPCEQVIQETEEAFERFPKTSTHNEGPDWDTVGDVLDNSADLCKAGDNIGALDHANLVRRIVGLREIETPYIAELPPNSGRHVPSR